MTLAGANVASTRDMADIAKVHYWEVAVGNSADFIIFDADLIENIANAGRINKI